MLYSITVWALRDLYMSLENDGLHATAVDNHAIANYAKMRYSTTVSAHRGGA